MPAKKKEEPNKIEVAVAELEDMMEQHKDKHKFVVQLDKLNAAVQDSK